MLLEGQTIDNTYRLIRLIGEGGMGAVYEATHARLAGRYAIKVLLPTVSANPEALTRFGREARITSLLQHPNVVEVIDYNTAADGTEYLVMEYLAGESLAQRLYREGSLPLDTVVGIVEQVAAGLAAAHSHGIVHRDLKPDNVFLVPVEGRETESIKILDFGISKVTGPNWGLQVPEGTLYGTPQYMAPEQIDGREIDVDAATDQFSLAVLAYEMLTGRNPFQGDTVAAVFSEVLNNVPAPTGVGHDVDLVVRRAMAKANRRRFPCVTDFADALRGAALGAGESREPVALAFATFANGEISTLKSRGRWRRSNWGLTLLATVVASVSISFVAGGAANHRSPSAQQLSASRVSASRAEKPLASLQDIGQPASSPAIMSVSRPDGIPSVKAPPLPSETPRAHDAERSPIVDVDATEGTAPPPAVVPLFARPTHRTSVAQVTSPAHFSQTNSPATSRSRLGVPSLPVDGDATLPLDEALGDPR